MEHSWPVSGTLRVEGPEPNVPHEPRPDTSGRGVACALERAPPCAADAVVHAPLTMRLLKCLNCKDFGEFSVVNEDKGIDCNSGEWTTCLLTTMVFIPLYSLGIPILLFIILYRFQSPRADRVIATLPVLEDKRRQHRKRSMCSLRYWWDELYWYWELRDHGEPRASRVRYLT